LSCGCDCADKEHGDWDAKVAGVGVDD